MDHPYTTEAQDRARTRLDRGANDVKILVAATVDHLRQSGVLTPAERRELFGLSDVAA
jgi:hypothetical protein